MADLRRAREVRVFLNLRTVAYRDGAKDPLGTMPLRYKAEWHTRGTSTVIYVSKTSTSRNEVIALARKWLARVNKPVALMAGGHVLNSHRTLYIDTTEQPERFGYSHPVKSFYPEPK